MSMSLEDALLNVWRQSLAENKKTVTLEGESFPVRSTAKRKLKQIDFQFDGKDLRGLEQNPDTKSRWAAMARDGKKVKSKPVTAWPRAAKNRACSPVPQPASRTEPTTLSAAAWNAGWDLPMFPGGLA